MPEPASSNSLPQAIFIDTCLFDQEHYHFTSTQLAALVAAAKGKKLKLLLPAATKQEIEAHIHEQTEQAISALKNTRKENPVLHRLKWLPSRDELRRTERELEWAIIKDWKKFTKRFHLIELDYSGIKISEVMQWYGLGQAPFGKGEKRKEFPDAFAFASLLRYAKKSGETVAIVSADNDFKRACTPHRDFHHFPSLAALTDSLLSGKRYHKAAMALATANKQLICDAISNDFPDRGFYHADAPQGEDYIDDVKVRSVQLGEIGIIGLGHLEFTVAFSATVSYTAHAEYDDPDSWVSIGDGDVMYLHKCSGPISDEARITGTIRFTANGDWTAIEEAIRCHIEDEMIEVTAGAAHCDEPDEGDPLE